VLSGVGKPLLCIAASCQARLIQRLLPPLLGLGVLLLAWQLAAMHSKGFPTPLSMSFGPS
jgi:hypothetical protein